MPRFHPTPESLHSEETGRPFSHCYDCGGSLLDSDNGHVLQKVYHKGEVIMEIAICAPCHSKLQASYSIESRERLWNFFLDHADFAKRAEKFRPIPVGGINPWINHCFTCGATRASCDEFAVAAHCLGADLIYGETPIMMCARCMEELMSLLSAETLGVYDDWLERCLPMAPANPLDGSPIRVLV